MQVGQEDCSVARSERRLIGEMERCCMMNGLGICALGPIVNVF